MSVRLCHLLNLETRRVNTPVVGINQSVTSTSFMTNAVIKSKFNHYHVDANFIVIDKITGNLPGYKICTNDIDIPKNIILADTNFHIPSAVDLLLGAEIFWDLLCVGQIRLNRDQPVIQKTKLGWIISGRVPSMRTRNKISNNMSTLCNLSTVTIQEQLEKFWTIEECEIKEVKLSQEEQQCEDHFKETTIRRNDGYFSVRLPTRDNIEEIGDTYEVALQRFLQLEKRLEKNSNLKKKYFEFFQEYEQLGHLSKIEPSERQTENIIIYLPHHGVYKESSETTKVRIVFDASARSSTGVSLNDKLKVGPTLQEDLFSILLRFRKHNYVIASDIENMYRMIFVEEDQRNFQRILWRSSADQPIDEYRLKTVTYGTASAAYLTIRCLQQVAHENMEKFPVACRTILSDFYVDDLLTGTSSVDEAKQLRHELTDVLSNYGFNLRKWMSNNSEVLEDPTNQHQATTHFIAENETAKTLGLIWNSMSDTLHYSINTTKFLNKGVTKRTILSNISQIFDPLGLAGPCIVKAKLIIQRLWQLGIEWDESIPFEFHSSWTQFYSKLEEVNKINIPRHCFCVEPINIQLHCFSDASELAYGACIYVRTTNSKNEHFSRLLCAKSRVAPLKKLSLPKLELCGAVLLSRLVKKVTDALNVIIDDIFYYTDSSIVLAWISKEAYQLKTFVSNRVVQIQRFTNMDKWRHVDSKDNPADIISRGANPNQLADSRLWWDGPWWLVQDEEYWPEQELMKLTMELPEMKGTQTFHVIIEDSIFDRYSSFSRLQRVTAYLLRFQNNTRVRAEFRTTGVLSVEELNNALHVLVRMCQLHEFAQEIRALRNSKTVDSASKLLSLNPFIDQVGLLRVGGLLNKANIPYDVKHQIILPSKHKLTKLIVQYEHKKLLHAGPQALLSSIRQKFWPISGRNVVKNILRQCVNCVKMLPKTYDHLLGELPPVARITPTRPFNICGVDYAGPFDIKANRLRGHRVLKAYMCVFVCFVTKAVHIDLVSDLTTDSFLNCLKRFIARRGRCSHIYSDNGTNFIGAKHLLDELSRFLNNQNYHDTVSEYLAQESITWHLIPPRSPHFGGLWESAVKSAKNHIKRVIGNTILSCEELMTLMTQVEAILNSRPLTPMTNNPDDLTILTPGHFLIGASLTSIPEHELIDKNPRRLSRYQHLSYMIQHFWHRWSREYLTNLQQRRKWKTKHQGTIPKHGSMVIVKDDNLPPLLWKIGRIEELFYGSDGVARVASVRTARGVFKRSVRKLCPLFFETEE